ncbi:MAG: DNA-processing protein DprA [Spirochaetaceae bacterium]|jgi:DNA processing protein|nr:DNA-processing protein DprA [Spirochaetaceae bacterium]
MIREVRANCGNNGEPLQWMMIMDETLFVCLVLCHTAGINRKDRFMLFETARTEAALNALDKGRIEEITGRQLRGSPDIDKAKAAAEKTVKIAGCKGIKMAHYYMEEYPPLLRESYEPPVLLYYRGVLSDPEKPLVAMVGTRHPSSDGQAWAYRCGRELGEAGLAVVSGLALGIDAMSHRGNIDGGGKTVAVLGSAVDEVYPSANRPLAKRILDGGGAFMSEYPPGTRPAQWTFPERNRIIAGLARGCVVVEAPEKSGALITARHAVENNRDLWIGGIGAAHRKDTRLEKYGAGTRNLAAQGGKVISDAHDIMEEWGMETVQKPHEPAETGPSGGPFSGGKLAAQLKKELGL